MYCNCYRKYIGKHFMILRIDLFTYKSGRPIELDQEKIISWYIRRE